MPGLPGGGPGVNDLEMRLAEALKREAEALEQQTATAEILRVISASLTDVQPVFDAIVRSAVRLCDGVFSIVGHFDGELSYFGAQHNFSPDASRPPAAGSRAELSTIALLAARFLNGES